MKTIRISILYFFLGYLFRKVFSFPILEERSFNNTAGTYGNEEYLGLLQLRKVFANSPLDIFPDYSTNPTNSGFKTPASWTLVNGMYERRLTNGYIQKATHLYDNIPLVYNGRNYFYADYSILNNIKNYFQVIPFLSGIITSNNIPNSVELENANNHFHNSASLRRADMIKYLGKYNRGSTNPLTINFGQYPYQVLSANGYTPAYYNIRNHIAPLYNVATLGRSINLVVNNPNYQNSYDPRHANCLIAPMKKRSNILSDRSSNGLEKRAGSCAVPFKVADTVEDPSSDTFVSKNDIDGFIALGYSLGVPEIGSGYDGENVPEDWDDYTELSHDFIFSGSISIDDALEKVEESIDANLENITDEDMKRFLARSISILRRGVMMRIANLKAALGNIRTDKQITAESRSVFLDRVSEKFRETFGKTSEEMLDEEEEEPLSNFFPDPILGSAPAEFDDYRSDEDIISVHSASALNFFQSAMPEEFGNTDEMGNVEDGGDTLLDVISAVPGSVSYRDMWLRIGDKIKQLLQKPGLKRSQLKAAQLGTQKLNAAVWKKQESIEKKLDQGIEVTSKEIQDYETLHDVVSSNAEVIGQVDTSTLEEDDGTVPELPEIGDFASLSDIPTKNTYKPTSGTTQKYLSGIKSIPHSQRTFNRSLLKSTQGTRRSTQ